MYSAPRLRGGRSTFGVVGEYRKLLAGPTWSSLYLALHLGWNYRQSDESNNLLYGGSLDWAVSNSLQGVVSHEIRLNADIVGLEDRSYSAGILYRVLLSFGGPTLGLSLGPCLGSDQSLAYCGQLGLTGFLVPVGGGVSRDWFVH